MTVLIKMRIMIFNNLRVNCYSEKIYFLLENWMVDSELAEILSKYWEEGESEAPENSFESISANHPIQTEWNVAFLRRVRDASNSHLHS